MLASASSAIANPPEGPTTPAADDAALAKLAGDPVEEEAPHKYQGSYWGLQAHAGVVYRLDAKAGDLPGPMVALSTRLTSIMSVADVQLTVQGSLYDVEIRGEDIGVKRLSTGLAVHLHPMFMQHLKNDDYHFWLAGIYGSAGVDLDITAMDTTAVGGSDRVEFDVGWHLGVGTDYPLTDVQQGWSLWIGLSYKLRFLTVDTGIDGFDNFHEHTFIITLGYRNNDIFFGRVPQPAEFDYRDPATREP